MHNLPVIMIILVLVVIVAVGAVLLYVNRDKLNTDKPETDTTDTDAGTIVVEETTGGSTGEATDADTNDGTGEDTPEETEEETIAGWGPKPVIEFDEGNEIYLDEDVIADVAAMEQKGEEDEVNEILDWLILLINRYAANDYSHKAICQIQRFYFLFHAEVMEESFDVFCERIEICIPADGATEEGFAKLADIAFGWGTERDYSYIFEGGGV